MNSPGTLGQEYDGPVARLEATLRGDPDLATLLDGFPEIGLPDAWLVAGCLAQTVWNAAAGHAAGHGIRDIDLVYFDPADLSQASEAAHEARLRALFPGLSARLDVKNQARVHVWYAAKFGRTLLPYPSSAAAIATYPTTTTAIGVRIGAGGFEVCAPFGLADLCAGIVRPNPVLVTRTIYEAKAARWHRIWPLLTVLAWPADR